MFFCLFIYHLYPHSLHWYVLLTFPAANTPQSKTEPILLASLIFSTLVDLQVGHLIAEDIGLPQKGQDSAEDDISFPQSEHFINPITYSPFILLYHTNLNLRFN